MTTGRRLMVAGGSSRSFARTDPVITVSAAPSGGWTQVQLDRAVHYAGRTYYGYHDGTTGNNELRVYTHATGTTGSAIILKAGIGGVEGSPDSHAAPILMIRDSDKKLLAFYSGHATSQLWLRVSTNSLDTDPTLAGGFAAESDLDSQLGKTAYTYPSAVQLRSVANDPIYLFFRDSQGVLGGASETSVLCYSVSTDGGATWSAATELFKRTNFLPYWVVDSDFENRIDIFLIDGTGTALGGSESPVKGWHFYFEGGSFRTSDGAAIGASMPYGTASLTQVYDGSAGDIAHAWDVNTNSGSPRALVPIDLGTSTRYDYCHWTGSAWECHTMATIASGDGTTAGLVFDSADPSVVYAMDFISSAWELFKYRTFDHGQTWSTEQLTSGGGGNNAPTRIRWRASDLRCLWFKGTGTSYLSYNVGTMGTRR